MADMTFQELMNAFHRNDHLNNTVVYGELLEQLKNDRITPVIGAGLSAWAKYPLWKDLIQTLAKNFDNEEVIRTYLENGKYEEAASALEEEYGHNNLIDTLTRVFSLDKLDESKRPPYQKLLPKLFKGPFVTTNFDVSLEKLLDSPFVVDPKNTFYENETENRLQMYNRLLIKLHGTVKDRQHMVFTKESYDSAYGDDEENPDETKPLPQKLKLVFQSAPPLFLGCSLGKDRTCRVLEKCSWAKGFALLGTSDTTSREFNSRLRKLSDMGIKVIWYPKGSYDAVEVLIEQLAEDMKIPKNS